VADGARRAEIKKAEGIRQAKIQLLKRLKVVENALATNAKVVVPAGTQLVNVIGELAGVLPLPPRGEKS